MCEFQIVWKFVPNQVINQKEEKFVPSKPKPSDKAKGMKDALQSFIKDANNGGRPWLSGSCVSADGHVTFEFSSVNAFSDEQKAHITHFIEGQAKKHYLVQPDSSRDDALISIKYRVPSFSCNCPCH